MTKPLLSIICTTYNHEEFIAQAIDGFLIQKTNFPIEIFINDDCSTDNTQSIIQKYVEQNPGLLNPIYQKENQYSLGKKNMPNIFPKCKGKYIALCEGDDYWTDPDKLQKQVDFLEANEDYAICFHPVTRLINNKSVKDTQNINQAETTTVLDLCKNNYIHTASCVFRNKLFEKFPESYHKSPAGDYFIHLLNAQHGKIKFLNEIMSVYRVHENGIWSTMPPLEQNVASCRVFEALIEHFEGDINSALLSSYFKLSNSITNMYKSENDRFKKSLTYYKSGINNPYFIMEHYDLNIIAKGFILKFIKRIQPLFQLN